MRTPASLAGHPIHPMLVPIAIGCFVFSFVADLVCLVKGVPSPNVWNVLAYYTMLGGIAGALAAAIPGLVDLLSLPPGPVKKIAVTHMFINLAVVGLYIANALMRRGSPQDMTLPMGMSLVAILMLLVSGWLGGKMVFEHGVGVDTTTPR